MAPLATAPIDLDAVPSDLISPVQAADLAQCARTYPYRLVKNGYLTGYRVKAEGSSRPVLRLSASEVAAHFAGRDLSEGVVVPLHLMGLSEDEREAARSFGREAAAAAPPMSEAAAVEAGRALTAALVGGAL